MLAPSLSNQDHGTVELRPPTIAPIDSCDKPRTATATHNKGGEPEPSRHPISQASARLQALVGYIGWSVLRERLP